MIRWLATIGLALISLSPISSNQPVRHFFSAHLVPPAQSNRAHLASPLPHDWIAQPTKTGNQPLSLSAANAYAIDLDSAQVLYDHDSLSSRPIASLAKIVTVLVILKDHSLDQVVTVPQLPNYQTDDVTLGLKPGQQFKIRDLLAAALIPSDNDAADALALTDSPSMAAFAVKMNRLVGEWGITNSHFTNANGLSSNQNLASAADLAKLAKMLLTNPVAADLVSQKSATISDLNGRTYNLISSNQLLGDGRIIGLKTGYTPAAGQCLVALAKLKGHRIITVVLNSPDRFAETATLVNWVENNWQWP